MEELLTQHIPVVVENGGPVTINRVISETGGEGIVYHVTYMGHDYAMKWRCKVDGDVIGGPQYNNISKICGKTPSRQFVWPTHMVRQQNYRDGQERRYGYLMELIPSNYKEMNNFLMPDDNPQNARFTYYYACRLAAAINISWAMYTLHQMRGWTYKDLNPKNFAFDPNTGDVLVIDNDNVSADRKSSVKGMIGYMAPEIPRSKFALSPSMQTDYYSLAIILYRLLFVDHPMEGKMMAESLFGGDSKEEMRIYELEPVFHFDPKNESNRPVGPYGKNANGLWRKYPLELRSLFTKVFTEGIDTPGKRPDATEWIRELSRAREKLVLVYNASANRYFDKFADFRYPQTVPQGVQFGMLIWKNGQKAFTSVISLCRGKSLFTINIDGDYRKGNEKEAIVDVDASRKKLMIINKSRYTWWSKLSTTTDWKQIPPNGSVCLEPNLQIAFRNSDAETIYGQVLLSGEIYKKFGGK